MTDKKKPLLILRNEGDQHLLQNKATVPRIPALHQFGGSGQIEDVDHQVIATLFPGYSHLIPAPPNGISLPGSLDLHHESPARVVVLQFEIVGPKALAMLIDPLHRKAARRILLGQPTVNQLLRHSSPLLGVLVENLYGTVLV